MKTLTTIYMIGSFIAYNATSNNPSISGLKSVNTSTQDNMLYPHQNEPRKITDLSDEVSPFIPPQYSILALQSGDLNFDKIEDCILILKKNGEDTLSFEGEGSGSRPLLILTRDKNGKLNLARRNDRTVYCYHCGGVMGDPFVEVVVKDGFFEIFHYGGSAWRWSRNIMFMYSLNDKEWYLHRDESESYHVSNDKKIETITKTAKDFGKIKFVDFNIDKDHED